MSEQYGALFKEKNTEKGNAGKTSLREKKRSQEKKKPRKEKHYCPPPPPS
jgi:hypothetical protein